MQQYLQTYIKDQALRAHSPLLGATKHITSRLQMANITTN